jgi:D-alanyl-D-alanine carboxypeptidase
MGYEGLIGGKTGFDNDSGWCLIEVAERDGTTLISVTLDGLAPDVWYQDNVDLLDLGFSYTTQRGNGGSSIQGQVLSYRDPDAVSILASSRSGASLGAPVGGAPQSQNPSLTGSAAGSANPADLGSSVASAASEPSTAGSEERSEILAVVAVACLIAAFAAFKAFGSRIMAGRHQTG